jgi:O-acetyl-ADP-ribose deacetylase (regulator of RNase III)
VTFVPLRFVTGDATSPQAPGPAIIAHVCNDAGRWGSGFVLAVSRRWWQPEAAYLNWYAERSHNGFGLGAMQLVPVQSGLWVANMVGQHGTLSPASGGRPPVRYRSVRQCLDTLGTVAIALGASVHMPRIGCGLAGGSWERMEPIISAALGERGVPVTVYDLETVAHLSFKCKTYGSQSHDPCSGTTDDGRELPCECWCHTR